MLAAVFKGEGRLVLEDVPKPEVSAPDDCLLKVEAASLCGTDIHILAVPPRFPAVLGTILGHEYVGKVVDIGDRVEGLKKGDRVVVDPNLKCGYCHPCRNGRSNICLNMKAIGEDIDGCFAEFSRVPAKAVFKVPADLPADLGALAEPLACVLNGVRKAQISPGDSVAVLGAGPIGLLFIQVFKLCGAGSIISSEVSDLRRRVAVESGATAVHNPLEGKLSESIGGVDVVVDAVGSLLSEGLEVVSPGGKLILFGMTHEAKAVIPQVEVILKELQILGSFIAKDTFPLAVELIAGGKLELEKLITHRVSLSEIEVGLEAIRSGEAIKVIVTP